MDAATSVDFTLTWLLVCGAVCVAMFVVPAGVFERASNWSGPVAVIAVFALAFVLRAVPAAAIVLPKDALVQFDMDSYRIVSDLLRSGRDVYEEPQRYPYLPFQMYLSAAAGWLDAHLGVPFLFAAKMPQVAADAGIAALLVAWRGAAGRNLRLGAVYAFNPASIFVASIHGQFDSIPVFFLLLALWIAVRGTPTDRRAALSGFVLGVAILAKSWPALALPLLARQAGGWRERFIFAVASGIAPLVALVVYCVVIGVGPQSAFDAVVGYSGVPDTWGYPLALLEFGNRGLPGAWRLLDLIEPVADALLVTAVALATLLSLRRPPEHGVALLILTFFVFTNGWGNHWLIWPVPFLLLISPWVGGPYVMLASATLLLASYGYGSVDYGMFEHFDLDSWVITWRWIVTLPIWVLTVVLAAFLAAAPWLRARGWFTGRAVVAEGDELGAPTGG